MLLFPKIGALLQRHLDHPIVILGQQEALSDKRRSCIPHRANVVALIWIALLYRKSRIASSETLRPRTFS